MSFMAYEGLCDQLKQAGLISVTVSEALRRRPATSFLLKHDVESNIDKALKIAPPC